MQTKFSEGEIMKINSEKLDYSLKSLIFLEEFILNSYDDYESLKKDELFMKFSSEYLGECFMKKYGGYWDIEKDEENAFYNLQIVKRGNIKICPLTLIYATLDRKKGDYLYKVVNNYKKYID